MSNKPFVASNPEVQAWLKRLGMPEGCSSAMIKVAPGQGVVVIFEAFADLEAFMSLGRENVTEILADGIKEKETGPICPPASIVDEDIERPKPSSIFTAAFDEVKALAAALYPGEPQPTMEMIDGGVLWVTVPRGGHAAPIEGELSRVLEILRGQLPPYPPAPAGLSDVRVAQTDPYDEIEKLLAAKGGKISGQRVKDGENLVSIDCDGWQDTWYEVSAALRMLRGEYE